ncbi:MAG: hybrid sensor histidine kinase/response regulator [Verrucomicrobiae bacterium]
MISSPQATPPEPQSLLEGKRVLLVDDDPHFLGFLRHLLQRHGVECLEATNGLEGLKVLAAEKVHFILSDINMPEMDGYEFLSAVRHQPQFEALPFILLTGRPAYSGLLSGLRHGADSYLPKPFDEPTILETINNCLLRQQRQEDKASTKFNEQRVNVLKMLPHELRTPLNGILGVADLLEMGETSQEELQQYAEILRVSGERMLRLTTNFLLCAELQMQADNPGRASPLFDSGLHCGAEEISEALEKRALAHERQGDLHHQIASGQLALPAEALAKVLDEILDNAFKFSKPGDPVTVTGEVAGDVYCWRIEDCGRSGAPISMLESRGLFIQFDRKTNEQQGAGMGLYLVEKLCTNYGGQLNFFSAPGGGITAEIRLPLAAETDQPGC